MGKDKEKGKDKSPIDGPSPWEVTTPVLLPVIEDSQATPAEKTDKKEKKEKQEKKKDKEKKQKQDNEEKKDEVKKDKKEKKKDKEPKKEKKEKKRKGTEGLGAEEKRPRLEDGSAIAAPTPDILGAQVVQDTAD